MCGNKIYAVFSLKEENGDEILLDFIFTFRPHCLQTWLRNLACRCFSFSKHVVFKLKLTDRSFKLTNL